MDGKLAVTKPRRRIPGRRQQSRTMPFNSVDVMPLKEHPLFTANFKRVPMEVGLGFPHFITLLLPTVSRGRRIYISNHFIFQLRFESALYALSNSANTERIRSESRQEAQMAAELILSDLLIC